MTKLQKLNMEEKRYAQYQEWFNQGLVSAWELECARKDMLSSKIDVMAE